MKKFEIWSREKLIGESDLEVHDPGMNVRSGRFHPRHDYAGVRSVFKTYSAALDLSGVAQKSALADYYKTRDELQLTVRTRAGAEVPSSAIHVVDLDDSLEDIQIEVYPPDDPLFT